MTAGFGIFAGASAIMAERQAARQDQAAMEKFQALHQIPIAQVQIPLTAGAGVYQMPDLLAPKAGYMWSVRRLVGALFTAGTVTVYKNGFVSGGVLVGGEYLFTFPSAGTYTFGRGEILLDAGDNLIYTATGITGLAQVGGSADCFERWLLPKYLG
jgi:hypothetical protein